MAKEIVSKEIETIEKLTKEQTKEKLLECYEKIKEVLKHYLDMKEDYYSLIAIWILGTYWHKNFSSYPYLYFNAMRGSGKSRALKLITRLSKDGNVMASPTEAVLFRTSGTIGIDEFEGVANKDKNAVRELLNGAYKKGIKIMRMKKVKSISGVEMKVEEFEVYRPVIMANIWGMEEVLEDRAITLILEKSNHPLKTRLVEDFEENEVIKYILKNIGLCSLCNVVSLKNINLHWNNYISKKYKTTLTTHTTLNTLTTQTTYTPPNHPLFDKVHESNIIGRDLELFLPLFFMAEFLGQEIEVEILRIAKEISASKKEDQKIESVDIMVYDFISRKDSSIFNYHSVKLLTNEFRDFSGETDDEINSKWFGRALKRLNLIINKRRKTQGMEIVLDVAKAQNKFKMFKK